VDVKGFRCFFIVGEVRKHFGRTEGTGSPPVRFIRIGTGSQSFSTDRSGNHVTWLEHSGETHHRRGFVSQESRKKDQGRVARSLGGESEGLQSRSAPEKKKGKKVVDSKWGG